MFPSWKRKWFANKAKRQKDGSDAQNGKRKGNAQIKGETSLFGAEYSDTPSAKQEIPSIAKGPNSVTFQLIGPDTIAIVGRNERIRKSLSYIEGAKFDETTGAYEFDLRNRDFLKNELQRLGYEVNDVPKEVLQVMKEAEAQRATYGPVDLDLLPPVIAEGLLPFQRESVSFAIQRGGHVLIGDDMGLGKTVQAIAIASYYMAEWPLLILCPSSLKGNWQQEIARWIPGTGKHVHVVDSSDTFRVNQVTIIPYDLAAKLAPQWDPKRFKVVIADESHFLKSPGAQRTKALLPIIRDAQRAILLTGTPALSRPVELYPQLLALHAPIYNSLGAFGHRYCNAVLNQFGEWDFSRHSNLLELNAILRHTVMIRRLKDDVLRDLPEKVRKIEHVEVDPHWAQKKQAPAANDLQTRLSVLSEQEVQQEASMEDEEEAIEDKPKKARKPKELRPGPTTGPDADILAMFRETSAAKESGVRTYIRKLIEEEKAGKTPTTTGLLSPPGSSPMYPRTPTTSSSSSTEAKSPSSTPNTTPGRKFLVFAHHISMLDVVEAELQRQGVNYIRIDGSTNPKQRTALVNQYQVNGAIKAAVLSLTCASVGLTLTAASLVIFTELFWNPGTLIQAEDRVHRLGQKAPSVELRYLFCKGTLDDMLWNLVGNKLKVVGTAINGQKAKLTLSKPEKSPMKLDIVEKVHVILDDDDEEDIIQPKQNKKRKSPQTAVTSPHPTTPHPPPGSTHTATSKKTDKRTPASGQMAIDQMWHKMEEEEPSTPYKPASRTTSLPQHSPHSLDDDSAMDITTAALPDPHQPNPKCRTSDMASFFTSALVRPSLGFQEDPILIESSQDSIPAFSEDELSEVDDIEEFVPEPKRPPATPQPTPPRPMFGLTFNTMPAAPQTAPVAPKPHQPQWKTSAYTASPSALRLGLHPSAPSQNQ